jgi:hypothetical protein
MSTFPFNTSYLDFPLSSTPYNSRIEFAEVTGQTSKNYVMHGFRPGFPLQSSELNEIQEQLALNASLNTTMNYYWGSTPAGWLGTCPLWPEKVLSDTDPLGPTTNLIEKEIIGSNIKIYANKGWYNVYSRISGFRHWVYLNTNLVSEEITPDPVNIQYIGFNIEYQQINATTDSTLYDNSSTNLVAGTPAGANRIKINILNQTNFLLTSTGNLTESNTFSPIVKILESFSGFGRYMNDKQIPSR